MAGISTFGGNKFFDHILRNQAYTPPTTVYASLHTADPGLTGANEVSSYTRQAVTLTAAASLHTDNNAALNFTSMPAVAAPGVRFMGLFDALTVGNFFWGGPSIPSGALPQAVLATASSDLFSTVAVHGLTTNDPVEFESALGQALPAGVTSGTVYYVIASGLTTTAFKVSTTVGGGALDITGDGACIARKVVEKIVNSGDTFQIATSDYDLTFVSG